MFSLSRDEARALDRRAMTEFGIPGIVLMENAGRSMAELLLAQGEIGTVVVCCGKGNNGGDGLVIARHLDIAGITVQVLLFADPALLAGDAAINHAIVMKSGLSIEVFDARLDIADLRAKFAAQNWIVDALFGSGLQGPVRPPLDDVIEAINTCGAKVFAVDIPSGLDADTGLPMGATIRADVTATVVAPKRGFGASEAKAWLGRVHIVGMGAPRGLLQV